MASSTAGQSISEKITSSSSPPFASTIISHKLIKPSSPTPPTQRWHKLSIIDQAFANCYMPIALFYTKEQIDILSAAENPTELSQRLEDSLSKILSSYYPFAGRLKDNTIADCNDMGAEFYHVQINCPISLAIEYHNALTEDMVFPLGLLPWSKSSYADRGLVVAQLSYFKCGGMAISMCISHKIGDGCDAFNLFHCWANITRDPNTPLPSLHYVQQSLYPPPVSTGPLLSPLVKLNRYATIQRRYTLSAAKLQALKALVAEESNVQNPTRTEVVIALLFKCAVAIPSSLCPSLLVITTNVRGMVSLSSHSVGNLLTVTTVLIPKGENLTLPNLVSALRTAKEQTRSRDNIENNQIVKDLEYQASLENIQREDLYNICTFSSLLQFSVEEIDFGWGKPAKVSIANGQRDKFCVYLVGNQSGGVDALVSWNEQELSIFELNAELLEFATPIPHKFMKTIEVV